MKPDQRAADLLLRGYQEVTDVDGLNVGARVRNNNEQYTEAYRNGTGMIERLFLRDSPSFERRWGVKDVELIVKLDKPRFFENETHSYVANYHVTVVNA